MGAVDDKLIEAAAREMLRERIKATPWYRIRMTGAERRQAIEREVTPTGICSSQTRKSTCVPPPTMVSSSLPDRNLLAKGAATLLLR
jgi:hypothetical protein